VWAGSMKQARGRTAPRAADRADDELLRDLHHLASPPG
jgi:hypothetical protein